MNRDEALAEMRAWGKRNAELAADRDPIILRGALAGVNIRQIASAMGVSRPTVYKAIGETRAGDPRDADRCEIERVDGEDGTTYSLTAWHGNVELVSIAGMSGSTSPFRDSTVAII